MKSLCSALLLCPMLAMSWPSLAAQEPRPRSPFPPGSYMPVEWNSDTAQAAVAAIKAQIPDLEIQQVITCATRAAYGWESMVFCGAKLGSLSGYWIFKLQQLPSETSARVVKAELLY